MPLQLSRSRGRASSRSLAASDLYGAVAREVIEFYGDQAEAHPVGTGPFRLAQWRRSSLIVLERNPDFREMLYDAEPAADDAEGQAMLARFKGRRLPMIDRVEISIIEEEQPRWLSFVNGEADVAYRVGYQFAPQAMPERQGRAQPRQARHPRLSDRRSRDPVLSLQHGRPGRRRLHAPARSRCAAAISLGIDVAQIIAYAYNGLGTRGAGRRRCPTRPATTRR